LTACSEDSADDINSGLDGGTDTDTDSDTDTEDVIVPPEGFSGCDIV